MGRCDRGATVIVTSTGRCLERGIINTDTRISKKDRPHDPGGGGGAIRCPIPQNGMMNNRNSPMHMITNRYEKPVQIPSRGAEVTSPDCVTSEQRMKTTTADKAEPSRYQETAVAAEGAGTDGTTNVRSRSMDCNKRRTTVRKLPTDCGEFTEQISARVSPVVAEMAHTDGTVVMQYQWDDRKSVKTTEMRMPRDYLEIPEPRLPRVFLDLAEEARNVKAEIDRSCYTKEVQPQGTGLTRPVFFTVMVDSPPVLKKGALRATGVSTERIPNMISAGRCEPEDQSGLVGPQNKTEQPVLLGSDADQSGTAPAGPVGHDIRMVEGPVGRNSTHRPVGTEENFQRVI